MNRILLKKMALYSLIIGAVCGGLVLIPIINIFVFLALISFSAVAVYLWLKKHNEIGLFEPKEAASYGGVMGGIAFLGFFALLIPLALILCLLNNLLFHKMVWFSLITTIFSMGITSGIVLITLIVFLMTALSAIFNAFFMMLAVAVMQTFDEAAKKQDDFKIDVEIK